MGSVKALKKLKKKTKKLKSKTQNQLQSLKKTSPNKPQQRQYKNQLSSDLKTLSGQVARDIASELTAPLNPVLSWFGSSSHNFGHSSGPVIRSISPSTNQGQQKGNDSVRLVLAATPMKSPPCKKCPALSGNLCKCAMKKFDLRAA